LILAVGLLACVLATTVALGRVAQGSTSLVGDPVLSALIHGVVQDAVGHLIATMWWTAGVATTVAVAVAVAVRVFVRSPHNIRP
jgi:hypothetical protein